MNKDFIRRYGPDCDIASVVRHAEHYGVLKYDIGDILNNYLTFGSSKSVMARSIVTHNAPMTEDAVCQQIREELCIEP